jgi:AcrR family transcriptional regulator
VKAQSSPLSTQPKYALQGGVHRRTESAILEGTKSLIALHGISRITMIDIADASEVSRATLYNHFRDKNAVLESLITSEVERLVAIASKSGTPADALESLSREISADTALVAMRTHDAQLLIAIMSHAENPLYLTLARCIFAATKSEAGTGLAMRWLLGQIMQPLTPKQSREQAELLVDRTLF